MNDPDQLEDELCSALVPAMPEGVTVAPLPDDDDEYDRPWKAGRVFVAYHSSEYEADEESTYKHMRTMGAVAQDQVFDILITVDSRTRRGPAGNHAILRAVKKALLGYVLSKGSALYLVNDSTLGRDGKIWTHALTFRSRSIAVQAMADDDQTAAPLQSVTFTEA